MEVDVLDYPTSAVCAGWRSAARAVLSLGTLIGASAEYEVVLAEPSVFYAAFPRAKQIAEGGWKRVFCAERAHAGRGGADAPAEALAVIDVEEVARLGLRAQLELELSAMHFCSLLVSERFCPHFVSLLGTFLLGFALPADGWDRPAPVPDAPAPGAKAADEGDAEVEVARGRKQTRPRRRTAEACEAPEAVERVMQVVHMELCSGDLEALTAGTVLPLPDVLAYALQMCVALFVAQRTLGMVHHDLKLLNFFARAPREAPAGVEPGEAAVRFTYVLPAADPPPAAGAAGVELSVELDAARPTLCLLSDFGTVDFGGEGLGAPICAHHFTTFENTPPDYLLLGARATQGPKSDSWTLGLAMLHLCTGHAPYEELLAGLRCPASLRAALNDAWASGRELAVVRKALARDEDGVLADTLYRYWVTLGPPAATEWLHASRAYLALSAWSRAHAAELGRDGAAFTLASGTAFATARARMAEAGGLHELVRGLLEWDPARRLTPEDALRAAEVFAPMRASAGSAARHVDGAATNGARLVCAREYRL
ncbi:kinase-like domain-containing protein [Pavlovales sp. CCMP2436]|nr:kinase-like domain-containing protein [Pavlovales sp. CCMP2436]